MVLPNKVLCRQDHAKALLEFKATERWMSGLSRTPGKRVWVYPHRGFESRPLRHMQKTLVIP